MENKFSKKDLADVIADKFGYTKKEANEVVATIFDTVAEKMIEGCTVDITGFGKFSVKTREARTGINPLTGEKIDVAETNVPKFKASRVLKDSVK